MGRTTRTMNTTAACSPTRIVRFTNLASPSDRPWISLARRIDDEVPFPYMVSFLSWGGIVVQTALPMCLRDQDLDGRCARMPRRSLIGRRRAAFSRGAVRGVAAESGEPTGSQGHRLKKAYRRQARAWEAARVSGTFNSVRQSVRNEFGVASSGRQHHAIGRATSDRGTEPRTVACRCGCIMVASGLIAGCLAAIGGEFTYPALHKEPDYPASVSSLSSSERAVARAVVRFKTRMAAETNQATAAYGLLGVALGVVLGVGGRSDRRIPTRRPGRCDHRRSIGRGRRGGAFRWPRAAVLPVRRMP